MIAIDVDDRSTWPDDIAIAATQLAGSLRGSTRYISDLAISPEEEDRFRERLKGRRLGAYHCTRLLDHEISVVREVGLLPLTASVVAQRIELACQEGAISSIERDLLLESHVFRLGNKTEIDGRRDQVCLILGAAVFDDFPDAVTPLLSSWGGEAIYVYALDRGQLLASLGKPTIVRAAIDLTEGWRVHLVAPDVARLFVGAVLGLSDRTADVFYRAPVEPEYVLDLWQPGCHEYDRFTELPQ